MPDKSQSNNGIAGLWLGTGASLLIIALVFHGPPDPDLSIQMHHVAEGHTRWALVHWTAAVALFLMSGAGFLNLIDQNTGGSSTGLRSAWLVLALGALAMLLLVPGGRVLVIEDIPAISRLNLIGHLIHRVENGEHIRPVEEYKRLYSEAGTIESGEVLQSGICDYYAAVLVVNQTKAP